MAQVLVRQLADEDVEALRRASEARGASLEAELRDIIIEAAKRQRVREALAAADDLVARTRKWLDSRGVDPASLPDSVELVREGRREMGWD